MNYYVLCQASLVYTLHTIHTCTCTADNSMPKHYLFSINKINNHEGSLNIPTFWDSQPHVQFTWAEAQLNLQKTAANSTKDMYVHVHSALDHASAPCLFAPRSDLRIFGVVAQLAGNCQWWIRIGIWIITISKRSAVTYTMSARVINNNCQMIPIWDAIKFNQIHAFQSD